jgi:hypothetical protein
VVSSSVVVLALAWVLHAAFERRAHVLLASLSVSLVFDTLALSPLWSLGQEISQWWWHHPGCGVPLPTSLGLNRVEIGSDWCQRAHSPSCAVETAGIFANWWYNLSTPLAGDSDYKFRGLAIAASVWPSFRLTEEGTPLS